MMTIESLLQGLKSDGVEIRLQGDDLRIVSSNGEVNADLLHQLRSRKPAIVDYLRECAGVAKAVVQKSSAVELAPLSYVQEDMWNFLSASRYLNVTEAFRLTGEVDVQALSDSFEYLVARHAALRTCFVEVDGEKLQRIDDRTFAKIEYTSLTKVPLDMRQLRAFEIASECAWRRFDLMASPLIRVGLIQISESEYVFIIAMDHFISDGFSLGIIIKEFASLYNTFHNRSLPLLKDLSMQYPDFAVWQRKNCVGQVYQDLISFWEQKLKNAPPLLLNTDHARPIRSNPEKSVVVVKPLLVSARQISAFSGENNTTNFVVFLSAFKALLSKWSGLSDIVVMTPTAGAGRFLAGCENIVGNFHSMVHLRTDLSGEPSFTELLRRVHCSVIEALAHQELHCRRLYTELPWTQLFNRVMFIGSGFRRFDWRSDRLSPVENFISNEYFKLEMPANPSLQDIRINMTLRGDILSATITFSPDLWEEGTIRFFWDEFCSLFERFIATPAQPISDFFGSI
jgi:hypothetical protein